MRVFRNCASLLLFAALCAGLSLNVSAQKITIVHLHDTSHRPVEGGCVTRRQVRGGKPGHRNRNRRPRTDRTDREDGPPLGHGRTPRRIGGIAHGPLSICFAGHVPRPQSVRRGRSRTELGNQFFPVAVESARIIDWDPGGARCG